MSRIQDNPIEAYHHYLRKGDYRKAARSLEYLISQSPKDIELLLEIIDLACNRIWEPELARKWLLRLIRLRTFWLDYALLGKMEAELDNLNRAKEYLELAKVLQKKHPKVLPKEAGPRELIRDVEDTIKYREALKLRLELDTGTARGARAARPEKAPVKRPVSRPKQLTAKKAEKGLYGCGSVGVGQPGDFRAPS